MTEWIDIDDRLPTELEEILITYNDIVLTGFFIKGKFFYYISGENEEQEGVTHWMPFPSPPEDKHD